MLKAYVGTRTSGLLFQTSSGAQMLQSNVLRDSLHPTLKKLKHVKGGLNISRRYRLTLLGKSDCPDVLKHFLVRARAETRFRTLRKTTWREGIPVGIGPKGSGSDSRFPPQLDYADYSEWWQVPRK